MKIKKEIEHYPILTEVYFFKDTQPCKGKIKDFHIYADKITYHIEYIDKEHEAAKIMKRKEGLKLGITLSEERFYLNKSKLLEEIESNIRKEYDETIQKINEL